MRAFFWAAGYGGGQGELAEGKAHSAGCSGGIQTGMLLRSEMHQNTAKAVMESSFFFPMGQMRMYYRKPLQLLGWEQIWSIKYMGLEGFVYLFIFLSRSEFFYLKC